MDRRGTGRPRRGHGTRAERVPATSCSSSRPTQVAANEAPTGRGLPHRRPGRGGQRRCATRTALTVSFVVTDTAKTIPVRTRASFPTCSRRARASWPRAARQRRRVPRERGARQARRELHAARSGRRAAPGRHAMAKTAFAGQGGRADDPRARPLRPRRRARPGAGAGGAAAGRRAARGNRAWIGALAPVAAGQFVFVAIAFACLAYAFVDNDFSVALRGRRIRTRCCRCTTASRPSGAATKARCCCGC